MAHSRFLLLPAAVLLAVGSARPALAQDQPGHETQFIRITPLRGADRPGTEPASSGRNAGRVPARRAAGRSGALPDVYLRTVGSAGSSVAYRKGSVRRVGVNLIEVNLRDPRVKIGV